MVALPAWLQFGRESVSQAGIDLGNGRVMAPEDVLEGHFRRVSARRYANAHKVEVQVGDGLIAAIAVLAPDLAPLTALAEDVSSAVPPVHPAPKFRADLQEALERTHRQHAAQRVLGTRPAPPTPHTSPEPVGWLVLLLIVGALFFWWTRRTHRQPA